MSNAKKKIIEPVINEAYYLKLIADIKAPILVDFQLAVEETPDKDYCLSEGRKILPLRKSKIEIDPSFPVWHAKNHMTSLKNISPFQAIHQICIAEQRNIKEVVHKLAEYEAMIELHSDFFELYKKAKQNAANGALAKEVPSDKTKPISNSYVPPTIVVSNVDIAEIPKPSFKKDKIQDIVAAFTPFIAETETLAVILENWSIAEAKLLFNGDGNRLADAFLRLYNAKFIVGCKKIELQKWVEDNFNYVQDGKKINKFTQAYLKTCISRNSFTVADPILDVIDGKVVGKY